MKTENRVINDGCKWQIIEKLSEVNPDIRVSVLTEALIVEAIDLGDLTYLVVTSENGQTILEADLESNKQGDRLH
jgi:ActR/RegA family two-component response regulator